MAYHLRSREDGKIDVIEGLLEGEGRTITTLDTHEEAVTYVADLDAAAKSGDTMPWELVAQDGKTCVRKKGETATLKCYATRDEAVNYLKALYANESNMHADAAIIATLTDDEFIEPVIDPDTDELIIAADRTFATDTRKKYASEGVAMSDGSFPIPDKDALRRAIASLGRSKNPDAAKAHIKKRARALGAEDMLPDSWSSKAASITAHAAPPAPPADFFSDPQFPGPQRYVTITADGRFMTHIALWGECHVGYGDMCVSPPREADYSNFTVGTVLTSDGNSIPTGVIAITGGHADVNLDAATARSKYDDTTTGKVDVAIGTDEYGIWASGAMRPDATEQDVHTLRASGVSGDWRMIDGQLRLIGICSVNVPGFPKLAMAASASGQLETLVAAGGPPLPHPDLCDCTDASEIASLKKLVADAGIDQLAIDNLSARIPTDDSELDSLYERIPS